MANDDAIPTGSYKEKIAKRIEILKVEGNRQTSELPRNYEGKLFAFVRDENVSSCHSWLNSVANLVRQLAPANSPLVEECNRLTIEGIKNIHHTYVLKMAGVLDSLEQEWKWGLLSNVEYIYVAETFDQFLDIAADYHKAKKKIESAVLASAVLEDTIKRICKKNDVEYQGKTLDPLIDDLVKHNVLTPVKAKRAKSYSGVRNHSLHADWDKFEIEDVGSMIQGIRELVDKHLSE